MNCSPKLKQYNLLIPLLGLIVFLLSGCAVTPDNWAFTKEVIKTDQLGKLKRIALLDVPPPSKIQLGPRVSEEALFWLGWPGFAVEAAGTTVTSGSRIAETTRKELKSWLELAGIEVILIDAERTKQSKLLKDYSQFTQIDADAILEVAPINVGFVDDLGKIEFCAFPPCDDSKRELSPDVHYKYRLVSAKSQEVLIQSNVSYSSFPGQYSIATGTNLTGPKEHIFKNSDAVKQQPEEAIRRLHHAIKEATKLISDIVTNRERALTKYRYVGNWRTERGSSSGGLYPYTVNVINEKLAKFNSARVADRGRIVFTSKSNGGRWEGYWIGSKPQKRCIEEKEGSRNWGIVIWQFDDTDSRFKGTWDFCGEGRKYQWTGRR